MDYELIAVGYTASLKAKGDCSIDVPTKSRNFGDGKSLLKTIRKLEKQGRIIDEGWLIGNKYYIQTSPVDIKGVPIYDNQFWTFSIHPDYKEIFEESKKGLDISDMVPGEKPLPEPYKIDEQSLMPIGF